MYLAQTLTVGLIYQLVENKITNRNFLTLPHPSLPGPAGASIPPLLLSLSAYF